MLINTSQSQPVSLKLNQANPAPAATTNTTDTNSKPAAYVSLSELGKSKAKQAEKNKDIDESDLPDNIKQFLRTIRDLKQQIADKEAEIEELKQNPVQSEQQQEKLELLESDLKALNSILNSTQRNLTKAMQKQQLSKEQTMTALSLIF